jgi:hypothetical protein
MKLNICVLIVMESLALTASCHHVCGFVPDHVLEYIRDCPLQDFDSQQAANRTLIHMSEIQDLRDRASGFEGFIEDESNTSGGLDDDSIIAKEQTAAGKVAADKEKIDYDKSDMGTAHPKSVESPAQSLSVAIRATDTEKYIYNNDRNCTYRPRIGTLVRKPGSSEAIDPDVNKVYADFSTIVQFYKDVFSRTSFDN